MRTPCALVVALVVGLLAARAEAQPARPAGSGTQVDTIRKEPRFAFCSKPKRPMFVRQRELCSLAEDTSDCEGFAKACGDPLADREKDSKSSIPGFLATLARGLVWLLVLVVVLAIAYPLVRALVRARRDRQLADRPPEPNVALAVTKKTAPEPERITDAEAALREADEHARRGDLARALGLYLAASLAALDRRGAIRLARHRTNGEYVRSCSDTAARAPLREIVREVDRVEFGNLAPTGEGVARVASRASALVRPLLLALLVLVLVVGCGGRGPGAVDDPAGDELPMEVLRRSGYAVSYLPTSLAALPMPAEGATAPIVVVDVTNVPLEEEASAHLIRWVEGGGVLVLAGPPALWPAELHVTADRADTRSLRVLADHAGARQARVATMHALQWSGSDALAKLGDSVYAARKDVGQGAIVGLAGDDLFTNIGAASPANAEALVAIVDVAARDRSRADAMRGAPSGAQVYEIHVARGHDGVPPPSNPFSALVQAGLGKGAWHALAAAVVLFLAFGIRHASARPAVPPARRAFAEHVEATGAFYGRARALAHALAAYGKFAELRLRERVPRGGDPVAFLAARAQVPHAEAARVWKRATEASAADDTRGDELATIRDLRALLVKALEQ